MTPLTPAYAAVSAGTEAAVPDMLRYLYFPLILWLIGQIFKVLSEARKEHLTQVRTVDALIHEADVAHGSWQANKVAFKASLAPNEGTSAFARRIAENEKYYPYVVPFKSTVGVFGAVDSPAKEFSYLKSETMESLVDFHDKAGLLNAAVEDMREKVFQELPKEQKLAALGKIIDLYDEAEAAYEPCRRALETQKERLTGRSFKWFVFFPWRSQSIWAYAVIVWIGLNAFVFR